MSGKLLVHWCSGWRLARAPLGSMDRASLRAYLRAPQPATRLPAGVSDVTQPPAIAPRERTRTLSEVLPPYRVVLRNDDVNEMAHVVRALLESVPELSSERAAEIMLEAHNRGAADVITCPLERAELYRDRLQGFGLTATIERV